MNWTNYTGFGTTKYRVASSSYDAATNKATVNLTEDAGLRRPERSRATRSSDRATCRSVSSSSGSRRLAVRIAHNEKGRPALPGGLFALAARSKRLAVLSVLVRG